jgi:hypothetical protein
MKIGIDTTFLAQVEILEHPGNARAMEYKKQVLSSSDSFALTPQVLNEFIHIVTDPRRFERPLSMELALNRAHTVPRQEKTYALYYMGPFAGVKTEGFLTYNRRKCTERILPNPPSPLSGIREGLEGRRRRTLH